MSIRHLGSLFSTIGIDGLTLGVSASERDDYRPKPGRTYRWEEMHRALSRALTGRVTCTDSQPSPVI